MYNERIGELSSKDNIKYVSVFKNHGKEAGTSIVHSHSQIIAYNKMPKNVADKISAVEKHENCPYCSFIEIEKGSDRRCFENNDFVAFTPYASRFHYEIWVMPLKHIKSISEMDDEVLSNLADIIEKIMEKLKILGTP